MGWTWYLANDFQFFLFLPIYCVLLQVYPRRGPFALIGTIFLQMFITVLEYSNRSIFEQSGEQSEVIAGHWVYTKPWCRITPYIVGIWVAHIYRQIKASEYIAPPSKIIAAIGTAITIFIAIVLTYYSQIKCPKDDPACGYGLLNTGDWGLIQSEQGWGILYMAVTPLAWTLSLASICVALFLGWGSIVKRFLEMEVWTPLARLTFNAYMFHMILILGFNNSQLRASPYSPTTMARKAIGNIVLAYSLALAMYLLVEKPTMNLIKQLLQRRPKSAKDGELSSARARERSGTDEPSQLGEGESLGESLPPAVKTPCSDEKITLLQWH